MEFENLTRGYEGQYAVFGVLWVFFRKDVDAPQGIGVRLYISVHVVRMKARANEY